MADRPDLTILEIHVTARTSHVEAVAEASRELIKAPGVVGVTISDRAWSEDDSMDARMRRLSEQSTLGAGH